MRCDELGKERKGKHVYTYEMTSDSLVILTVNQPVIPINQVIPHWPLIHTETYILPLSAHSLSTYR